MPNKESMLESGDPSGNSDAFRRALGNFATGVTIITSEANGVKAGITANSFSSVSLDPPLILWSVKKTSTSWPVFAQSRSFAVNVLASDQAELARQFARSGVDKFAGVAWERGEKGAPLLAHVAAQFECLRHIEYEGGDHLIVIGEVTYFARHDRRPLLFSQGRFSIALDSPEVGASAAASTDQLTFLTLLRRAFLQRSSEFTEEARAVGFTMNESRLAYHLSLRSALSLEEAARVALMDMQTAEDSARSLLDKGWIRYNDEGKLEMTPAGTERNLALAAAASREEAAKVARFSPGEIETARKVIAAFGGRLDNIPRY